MVGYIYILVNPVYWNMVKIGYTGDIKRRLKELNSSTSVPIEYECYALYEVPKENADKKLHKIIDMLNPMLRVRANLQDKREREFYSMAKEDAYALLKNIAEISDTEDKLHLTNKDGSFQKASVKKSKEGKKKKQQKPFSFSEVNISFGSTLTFTEDETVTVTVFDDRHVKYNGEVTSMSALAQKLTGKNHALQGTLYFKYNGKVLTELRKEIRNKI